ncbi:hypothetical protein J421_5575 (plasmid) [Gemmatirosa kalamazoonensis]|uniref:Uncharacterized protein n=1 Tax=Gemmatirosa kalamazoonensis TaxID=861299 RepID=W0RNZ9_9BACT|nr:hypothetical protein J421_4555 [Gemmatirosa kalamazoonensis]AHG92158.1 hypothetical protein J421_4623 [Gemmatirosa kalamazoonensis]AHG93110.1 hypothetical protein J421_5575 [Gemmatirosa kalamazoonensis]
MTFRSETVPERPIDLTPATPRHGCEAVVAWIVDEHGPRPVLCGEPVTHVVAGRDNEDHVPACEAHVRRLTVEHRRNNVRAVFLSEFIEARRAAPYVADGACCQCGACEAARAEVA